jgi:hypothetical protein
MKVSWIVGPVLVGALAGGVTEPTGPPRETRSTGSLRVSVDAALDQGDFSTAVRTAEAALRRATRDGRWESLVEVGDAYHRIAVRDGAPEAARDGAREAYQAALRSARRAESLDGVLRVAEAFARLGDVEDVEGILGVARSLAGADAEAIDDVQVATTRLADLLDSGSRPERGED